MHITGVVDFMVYVRALVITLQVAFDGLIVVLKHSHCAPYVVEAKARMA